MLQWLSNLAVVLEARDDAKQCSGSTEHDGDQTCLLVTVQQLHIRQRAAQPRQVLGIEM